MVKNEATMEADMEERIRNECGDEGIEGGI